MTNDARRRNRSGAATIVLATNSAGVPGIDGSVVINPRNEELDP